MNKLLAVTLCIATLVVALSLLRRHIGLYKFRSAWRRARSAANNNAPPASSRLFYRVGAFVCVYLTIATTIFLALSMGGVNITLMTSFLSAPLWVSVVLLSLWITRRLP